MLAMVYYPFRIKHAFGSEALNHVYTLKAAFRQHISGTEGGYLVIGFSEILGEES
jgi:hypothetical protein